MTSIPSGVYPARQLIECIGRAGLRALLASGDARLLRFGWYAVGLVRSDEEEAVRRGGVVSCVSALTRHGVWVPEDHRLHVRGNSSAVRTRKGPFCREFRRPSPEGAAVDDLDIALRHAARCLDPEGFVVVVDSILNRRLMSGDELEYQFRDAPEYVHELLAKADGRADSGPETMTRLRLRGQSIKVRVQVQIDGLGRVDLLVGDYMIVEIDGREWHGTTERQFERDRERDAIALELGYYPLRFTYKDVVFRWAETNARILAAIRAGAHSRPVVPRTRRAGGE